MRIAPLSESTPPPGSTSVGICPSGLSFRSSRNASLGSHDAVSITRYGAPINSSAACVVAEPDPFLPYNVYIVPPGSIEFTVLVRCTASGLGVDPHEIVIGIEAIVAGHASAQHQQPCKLVRTVDEVMG